IAADAAIAARRQEAAVAIVVAAVPAATFAHMLAVACAVTVAAVAALLHAAVAFAPALGVVVAEPGRDFVARALEEAAVVAAALAERVAVAEALALPVTIPRRPRTVVARPAARVVTVICHGHPPAGETAGENRPGN